MSEYDMGVIGLVLGVLGILAGVATSYYFYLRAREVVDPRYALARSQLLPASSDVAERLKFFYDGVEVTNLNICSVILWNRGRRTLSGTDIAPRDPLRVELPEGCRALTAEVEASREAINLRAAIDAAGTRIEITFDFLDKSDGGSVEILYQGEPRAKPILAGTLRGAPAGFRPPPYRVRFGDDEDNGAAEEGDGSDRRSGGWPAAVIPGIVLSLLAAGGVLIAGWAHPITVVVLTLLTLWALLMGGAAVIVLVFKRSVGLPDSFPGAD